MSRWGKGFKDKRDWREYNEQLVVRGKFYFDLNLTDKWDTELKEMNRGKRGSPFLFPNSFMTFMMLWHQYLDYRALEGMGRVLAERGIIPAYGDYSTIWNRIHDSKQVLDITGLEYAEIASDGTGLKTNNAGEYRITKYGDKDAKRKRH